MSASRASYSYLRVHIVTPLESDSAYSTMLMFPQEDESTPEHLDHGLDANASAASKAASHTWEQPPATAVDPAFGEAPADLRQQLEARRRARAGM